MDVLTQMGGAGHDAAVIEQTQQELLCQFDARSSSSSSRDVERAMTYG